MLLCASVTLTPVMMLVHVRLVSHIYVCFIRLLNTGLDSETLAICVRLCEQVPDDHETPEWMLRLILSAE